VSLVNVKGRVVNAVKAYGRRRDIVPLIRNLGNECTSRPGRFNTNGRSSCTLCTVLGRRRRRSGRLAGVQSFFPLTGIVTA